jgi:hypothetical protein
MPDALTLVLVVGAVFGLAPALLFRLCRKAWRVHRGHGAARDPAIGVPAAAESPSEGMGPPGASPLPDRSASNLAGFHQHTLDAWLQEVLRSSSGELADAWQTPLLPGEPFGRFVIVREIGRGDAVDGQADVHALGAVLFGMVTGRLPFADGVRQPAGPDLDLEGLAPLGRLVSRCLAAVAVLGGLGIAVRSALPESDLRDLVALALVLGAFGAAFVLVPSLLRLRGHPGATAT